MHWIRYNESCFFYKSNVLYILKCSHVQDNLIGGTFVGRDVFKVLPQSLFYPFLEFGVVFYTEILQSGPVHQGVVRPVQS